jgi:ATP-binding cassette, subfamily C, bacterial LapB
MQTMIEQPWRRLSEALKRDKAWRRLSEALNRNKASGRLSEALNFISASQPTPIQVQSFEDGTPIVEPSVPPAVYLASLVISLLALALPLVTLQIYDRIIPNRARETLAFLIVGLVVALALDLILRTTRSAILTWQGMRFVRRAEHEAVTRLIYAPKANVAREAVTIHVNRLAALTAIGDHHAGQWRLTVIDLPFVAIALVIMAMVGGLIVMVPICLFFLFSVFAMRRTREFRKATEERTIQDNKKYDFVAEALVGIHTVKSMAMEPQMQRRFERLQQAVAEITMGSILTGHAAQTTAVLYGNISQIAVVTFGAARVIDGHLSVGALACCTMLSGQILQPVLRVISLWTEKEVLSHKRKEARELLSLPPAKRLPVRRNVDGRIRFDNVTFSFHERGPAILLNINLSVKAGEVVGFKGRDDLGRSKLLKLLRGEVLPTAGRVTVDDVATTDPAFAAIRGRVAYVGSAPVIFQGTILDNLTMFSPARHRVARQMAALVGLEGTVNQLPSGFDTMLGEGAANELPVSIAQQITIVRALAAEPRILLFDDANVVLDRRAEMALIASIGALRQRMTIIIATHRPSLLAATDVIYTITDGRIEQKEEPNHQTLPTAGIL